MKSNDEDKDFKISLLNNGSLEKNTFQLHFLQRCSSVHQFRHHC